MHDFYSCCFSYSCLTANVLCVLCQLPFLLYSVIHSSVTVAVHTDDNMVFATTSINRTGGFIEAIAFMFCISRSLV
jgi:ABC-type amino acid transport system permease subunit